MVDTEDGVESVDIYPEYDLPLDKVTGKSVPIYSDDEETVTTSQISTAKDDRGVEETITNTRISTKKGPEGVAQRVTKVTKTQKVVNKVTKVQRQEESEGEEEEEETKSAISITELSDDEKTPGPSTRKSTRTTQHITRVCFLFLFCHNIQLYILLV